MDMVQYYNQLPSKLCLIHYFASIRLTAAAVPSVHPPLPAAALDNSTPYHFLSLSQSQCLPSDNETSPSVWLAAGSSRLISCINFDDDADDDDTD